MASPHQADPNPFFVSENERNLDIEGEIAPAKPTERINTLDEPIMTTIKRDADRIAIKLKTVLMPRETKTNKPDLQDWDLWGPLCWCLLLSISLSINAPNGQESLVFASVFVIVWCGAGVVTLNAQMLGGKISFFQSVCVLGYCIFPLNISSLLCLMWSQILFKLIVVIMGLIWSIKASVVFISQLVPEKRKALATYPVLLFYVVIAWMIALQ